jgi:hypothetical protein
VGEDAHRTAGETLRLRSGQAAGATALRYGVRFRKVKGAAPLERLGPFFLKIEVFVAKTVRF